MGSLADAVFHFLFGWVKDLFRTLWRVLFQGGGATAEYAGLSRSWIRWALILCLICTVVDIAVHLLRWRPIHVWASFFRRLRGEGIEASSLEPAPLPAAAELPPEPLPELHYEDPMAPAAADYSLPGFPDSEGDIVPEEAPEEAPDRPGLLRRIAAKTRTLAGDEEDPDLALRFKPEPMPVRPEQAYQQPVYPPSWKNER